MKYQELLILLPCHSLEDFPTYPEGDDAQSLLSCWSALWHPVLLANAGQAPAWRRIEDPPAEVKDRLIVVPSVCVPRLPTGFSQRVKDEGGCIVRKTASRQEIVEAALAPLGDGAPPVDPEVAADFLALGYCYLQVELLTRQMRYSSNLDEVYFKGQAVGAAVAAAEGDLATAREKLHACFSVLAEERDHYYPVDAFLLDLNLTATTTLGGTLRQELAQQTPTNLLLSAALLKEMQQKEPASLDALRAALEAEKVGLIGGEDQEERLPLLSHETILAALRHGLAEYESILGRRPEVFGRWRFGLTPTLPGILSKLGFRGALHACFEEGNVPGGTQFKVRWEGIDGSVIDSIARPPLDASKPQTFLSFATKMGESMDADHVATLCLAHWPGQASEWLTDLRRIAGYCKALGKFVTVQQYFEQTDLPGHLDRFEADRYRSPYLKQAVIRKQDDPLSTSVRYWQREYRQRAEQALSTLTALVGGKTSKTQVPSAECRTQSGRDSALCTLHSALETPADSAAANDSALADAAAAWADMLAGGKRNPRGCLILNPCSFVRRVGVELPAGAALPEVAKPVYAADEAAERKFAVVDLPPAGFVWLGSGAAATGDKKALSLVEDNTLRNEFFEVVINPTTGGLAAMHEYQTRGNRLSQQVALRIPGPKQRPGDTFRDPDETATYTVMAADALDVTCATTAMGEIVVRGRLLDLHGEKLAGFVQTYRVWRGSRVLQIDVELDPLAELKPDPWSSYFCCRFAWADETAELFRTVNETRQSASGQRFESPHYIEIAAEKHTTTILTGGLPFHRRHESRMLDTLLISRGETQRKFRLGIGMDLTHPMLEAVSLLSPPVVVPAAAPPTSGTSGWLFHIDARNVIATHWEPIADGTSVSGFRVRLLETAGRPANLSLSAFRPVKSARQVDFRGEPAGDCTVTDGKIRVDLPAHGWTEVLASW
jgi:alpha-mannosidase